MCSYWVWILYSTEEGVHQHPCLEVVHPLLHLVPGHRQRSLLRGHPAPLEKCVGCLPQQVLQGEGIGHRLQQLLRQKLVIPRHPSSQTGQEKVVFLSLLGELQVKVKVKQTQYILSSFTYKVLSQLLVTPSTFQSMKFLGSVCMWCL